MGGGVRPPEYFRTLRGRALEATNLLTDEESAIKELVSAKGLDAELLVPAVHRRHRRDLQRARRRHVPEPGRRARPPGARGRDVRQAGRRVGLARRRRHPPARAARGSCSTTRARERIAAALRELIADPELRARLGQRGARARARALRPDPQRARGRGGLRRAARPRARAGARAAAPSASPPDVRALRHRRARAAARDRDRAAHGRGARPPRPRRRRRVRRRRRRARLPPARDHRPERRGQAAVRERRRRAAARCTTARSTTTASCARELEAHGHRFRIADRHGGDRPRVRGVGRRLRRAVQRHVGARALGRPAAAALLLARPLRREAVLLLAGTAGGSRSRAS